MAQGVVQAIVGLLFYKGKQTGDDEMTNNYETAKSNAIDAHMSWLEMMIDSNVELDLAEVMSHYASALADFGIYLDSYDVPDEWMYRAEEMEDGNWFVDSYYTCG